MYENKISARQLRRMIFIEIFGAGALSIPTFACYKEQNGFWSLIFYGVFLAGTIAFFIIFSGKISEENFENRKIGKTGLARNVNINVSKMQTRLICQKAAFYLLFFLLRFCFATACIQHYKKEPDF